jgi:hypothetical protein
MAEATIAAREQIGRVRRDLRRELLADSDRARIDELFRRAVGRRERASTAPSSTAS